MRVAAIVTLLLAWSCRTGALQCGAVEPSTSGGGVSYDELFFGADGDDGDGGDLTGNLKELSKLNDPVIDIFERDEPAAPLADKDFQLGRTVDTVYKTGEQPLSAGQFQGDIVGIDPGAFEGAVAEFGHAPPNLEGQQAAVVDPFKLWDKGRVPYTISKRYTACGRAFIARAMEELSEKTCIEFVPHASEKVYIHLTPLDGCWSYVGRQYDADNPEAEVKQIVSIGEGCVYKGIILHELMHAIGFFHEHSRHDRDAHIRVMKVNVEPNFIANFDTYDFTKLTELGTPYDLTSIMHYGRFAFSTGDKPTILTQDRSSNDLIGQRKQLSALDVDRVKKLYQCDLPRNCRDQSHWCPTWAANDMCETRDDVRTTCSRSCGNCDGGGDARHDAVGGGDGGSDGGGGGDGGGDGGGFFNDGDSGDDGGDSGGDDGGDGGDGSSFYSGDFFY